MSKEIGLIRTQANEIINTLNLNVGFEEFYSIIKVQCFKGKDPSHAQLSSFLVLASTYRLNPLLKEIYAFPSNGGIQPIISIDGWLKIAHSNGTLRGIKHEVIFDKDGKPTAVKCVLSIKDWDFPVETIELMSENKRDTPTWKQYPLRMLKHRATAQAIRMAFNVNAMLDDEYEAMSDKQRPSKEKVMTEAQLKDAIDQIINEKDESAKKTILDVVLSHTDNDDQRDRLKDAYEVINAD